MGYISLVSLPILIFGLGGEGLQKAGATGIFRRVEIRGRFRPICRGVKVLAPLFTLLEVLRICPVQQDL
jgi:hypothetical protein